MITKAPILPTYINKINKNCESGEKTVVEALDKPVVPIAEATSNMTSLKPTAIFVSSIPKIAREANTNKNKYKMKTAVAFLVIEASNCLLPTTIFSFLLVVDKIDKNITAMVVVLIPPAVEPEEPPINIKAVDKATEGLLKAF